MKFFKKKLVRPTFKRDTRGSITVMVAMMLIPIVVVETFMVDLARIKLYGDQAVMVADNYGEAALTVYDNLLKDLYGFFAISQNESGTEALENLNSYVKSSFNPNESAIYFNHTPDALQNDKYSGFMPYKDADVELTLTENESSALSNNAVFSTQLGDFMKFRIVQAIGDKMDAVFEAAEAIQNIKKDAEAAESKQDFDNLVGELLELAQKFYNLLTVFEHYPAFLQAVNTSRQNAVTGFNNIAASDTYKAYIWWEFDVDQNAVRAALDHEEEYNEKVAEREAVIAANAALDEDEEPAPVPPMPEPLSAAEQELISKYRWYQSCGSPSRNTIKAKFDQHISNYKASWDGDEVINFDSYSTMANNDWSNDIDTVSKDIADKYTDIDAERKNLESMLNDPNISESLKTGIREDLKAIDDLFSKEEHGSARYTGLAKLIVDQNKSSGFNPQAKKTAERTVDKFESARDAYLNNENPGGYEPAIGVNQYDDFNSSRNPEYRMKSGGLYYNLHEVFGNPDTEAGKDAKNKRDKADSTVQEVGNKLSQDEATDAPDIPDSFVTAHGISKSKFGSFVLADVFDSAVDLFNAGSLGQGINRQILKLYTVAYDFSMFTNRTTGIEDGKKTEETLTSLTGYELCEKINYLYMAELEYILGGSKYSSANLNKARNDILTFRAVVNFTATYTITEIDSAIDAVRNATMVVNPALAYVVAAALRLAVTALETGCDWDELKKGNEVTLIKTKWKHLTAADKISDVITPEESKNGGGDDDAEAFGLDYEQYLLIMIIFMASATKVATRTADLVELNINHVAHSDGHTFCMDKAYTAVDATCTVQMDFAIMPKNMAQSFMDDDSYALLETNEKNAYAFRVTRGY